jgi:outer membrane receptor for Fe3+-dicitrate
MRNLTVNIGARIEWVPDTHGNDPFVGWNFSDDFFTVLPGVGASYQITPCLAVFGNYFEGFRAPQVWGYASNASGSNSLEFEKGRSAEFGFRWKGWRGLSGSLTGWRTEYDDFGVFYTGTYENLGNIEAYGADLIVDWDLGQLSRRLCGFSAGGSVTLQDSEIKSGPNSGNETPYAWSEKAAWRVRYERAGWHASLGGTYVGESFSDDANTAIANPNGNLGINPNVTLWDARVSKRIPLGRIGAVEFAVGATNLFDANWYVHSRGGFFGGGMVAGAPRQVYGSAQITLSW